jgi:hypothetical protein
MGKIVEYDLGAREKSSFPGPGTHSPVPEITKQKGP